jgi:hypothetical protein
MGFNYAAAGYSTPQEYEAAQYNEVSQVRSMANFINGINLTSAIQQHDFMTIAKKYNGDPSYAAKLEAAYNKIKS